MHVMGSYVIEQLERRAICRWKWPDPRLFQLIGKTIDQKAQFFLDPPVQPLNLTPSLRRQGVQNDVACCGPKWRTFKIEGLYRLLIIGPCAASASVGESTSPG
jgi:hypothetical protein